MSIDVRLLREALSFEPSGDDEPPQDLTIEKMGDESFDWILRELRSETLTTRETIRALRLLARLTRHFCVQRKGELLGIALTLAQHPSVDRGVRSAAVHLAIMEARIAYGLQDAPTMYGRAARELEAEVSKTVRAALDLGLTPQIDTFTREFLSDSVGSQ